MSSWVDAGEVLRLFADLDGKRQKKVHRDALRSATGMLVKEARRNFRTAVRKPNARNSWNGKTFSSGIKSSVDREATEGKVHIMGDFRLKFFELGTRERRKRKSGARTGRIAAHYFFRRARLSKEAEISALMNGIIEKAILKAYAKHKNR